MAASCQINRTARALVLGALGLAFAWGISNGLSPATAQTTPAGAAGTNTITNAPEPLVWVEPAKTNSPKSGEATVNLAFVVTNISDQPVAVLSAVGSCGCTVPSLPSSPWWIPPHTSSQLPVVMNLIGKMGTFTKTVTVVRSNLPSQVLSITINMPDSPDDQRLRNQIATLADRQAIFKGDCASCHAEPAKGKKAKELYAVACGICHEAEHRATMVPNLRALSHQTDLAFWKQLTAEGRPGTMMPAFSEKQGGPLTDEQIQSLAETLAMVFPSDATLPLTAPTNAGPPSFPIQPGVRLGGAQPAK